MMRVERKRKGGRGPLQKQRKKKVASHAYRDLTTTHKPFPREVLAEVSHVLHVFSIRK